MVNIESSEIQDNDLPEGVIAQVTVHDDGRIVVSTPGENPGRSAHLLGHVHDAVIAEIEHLGRLAAGQN